MCFFEGPALIMPFERGIFLMGFFFFFFFFERNFDVFMSEQFGKCLSYVMVGWLLIG